MTKASAIAATTLLYLGIITTSCNQAEPSRVSSQAYYTEIVRCAAALENVGEALNRTSNDKYLSNWAWVHGMVSASADITGISPQQSTADVKEAKKDAALRLPAGYGWMRAEGFLKEVCQSGGPKTIPFGR